MSLNYLWPWDILPGEGSERGVNGDCYDLRPDLPKLTQIWSLSQLYSDSNLHSWIHCKMGGFFTNTQSRFKGSVRYSWRFPLPFAPGTSHLMVSSFLCTSRINVQGEGEGHRWTRRGRGAPLSGGWNQHPPSPFLSLGKTFKIIVCKIITTRWLDFDL